MAVTDGELTYARSWIGNKETEDAFNERVDRLEAEGEYELRSELLNAAVVESLRAQLSAMMLDRPGNASVGSVSYSNSTNIQELAKKLREVESAVAVPEHARLVRPRRR